MKRDLEKQKKLKKYWTDVAAGRINSKKITHTKKIKKEGEDGTKLY